MKKRIVLLTLSLLLIVGMLGSGDAYAWFTSLQGGSQHVNYIKSGVIDYSIGSGAFIVEGSTAYPEQNLLTGAVSLTNTSDITTALRIKITYTYDNQTYVCNPKNSAGALDVTLTNPSSWTYNSTDGYTYYNGTVDVGANVALFSKLCFSGPNTGSDFKNQHVVVTVYYEAHQWDYLGNNWSYTMPQ